MEKENLEVEKKSKGGIMGGLLNRSKDQAPVQSQVVHAPVGKPIAKVEKKNTLLKDVHGKDVDEKDYFFSGEAPGYFNQSSGEPVTREDMIEVFERVFNSKHGFLFYKDKLKEVYLVIVPIEHATEVGEYNNSVAGDFQKHAISFLNEGSVNLETLETKLKRILNSGTIKISN